MEAQLWERRDAVRRAALELRLATQRLLVVTEHQGVTAAQLAADTALARATEAVQLVDEWARELTELTAERYPQPQLGPL